MPIRRTLRRTPSAAWLLYATSAIVALLALVGPAASGTAQVDSTPPVRPSGFTVSASATSLQLAWAPSTDDVGVTGYDVAVYLGTSYQDPSAVPLMTVTTPLPSTTLTGLRCGTGYGIVVEAFDAAGNRSKRAAAVVPTANCADTTPPTAPNAIRQAAHTQTSVTIKWTKSTDDTLVAGYRLYMGALVVGTTQATSYTFAGMSCGSTQDVAVAAYDLAGNTSPQTQAFVTTLACTDTVAPTTPTGLAQVGATQSSVGVAWKPSTDNTGVASYAVLVGGLAVGSTSGTSYVAGSLACERSYTVSVVAVDGSGNRSAPAAVNATTSGCPAGTPGDTTSPTTPASLSVGNTSQTQIQLRWQPSTDNVAVAGYGTYLDASRVDATSTTSYTFAGLTCGTTHQLGVDAFDGAGNRSTVATVVAASAACTDTTPPTDPSNLVVLNTTDTSITMGWASSTDNVGVTGYKLYRDGASVATTSQTSYTFTGLTCATSYTLATQAVDASGNVSIKVAAPMTTSACPDLTPPPAPTALSTSNVTQTSATLAWTASAGAAGYEVYLDGAIVGSTAQTSYVFGALACGTTYTLGVDAYDTAGNQSTQASRTVTTSSCSAPPPTGSATISLSTTGNDTTCVRGDSTKPCKTFQRAYDIAKPGDVVSAAAGTYSANDPGRDAITIFGAPKSSPTPVTFKCASSGTVTHSSAWFTIKAFDVSVVGGCFRLHALRLGEPGDGSLTTQNVTVDGAHVDGLEVVGAQGITLKNLEIGPNVYCAAQSSSNPASMKCDPSASPFEAFYANRGTVDLPLQPYFHNNKGGINPTAALEGSYVHDIQTKDANRWHTGCGLIWTGSGAPSNSIVFRGNRFDNCAVDGLIFDRADGVTIENNMFGYPVEPLSNGMGAATEANKAQREVVLKTVAGWTPSNWLIRFNSFAHGLSIDNSAVNSSYSNFRVIGNILGSYTYCENRGETFDRNVFVGPTCGANSLSIASFPYVRYQAPIDYHLAAAGPFVDHVSGSGSDYTLATDYDGQQRPLGAARDAGADEKQ